MNDSQPSIQTKEKKKVKERKKMMFDITERKIILTVLDYCAMLIGYIPPFFISFSFLTIIWIGKKSDDYCLLFSLYILHNLFFCWCIPMLYPMF